jgi:hypothetical protein
VKSVPNKINSDTKIKHAPSTGCGTFLAESTTTEFARKQSRTGRTHDFTTIVALVHFVATPTVKSVTAIAHSNFMIRLKLVTPVTVLANIRTAFVAANLHLCRFSATVKTKFAVHTQQLIVVAARGILLLVRIFNFAFIVVHEQRHVILTAVVSTSGATSRFARLLLLTSTPSLGRERHVGAGCCLPPD